MAGCSCGAKQGLTEEQKKILQAFKNSGEPLGAKDVSEVTGIDKKLVSDEISKLKKKNLLDSPVRCKYGITGDGVNAL